MKSVRIFRNKSLQLIVICMLIGVTELITYPKQQVKSQRVADLSKTNIIQTPTSTSSDKLVNTNQTVGKTSPSPTSNLGAPTTILEQKNIQTSEPVTQQETQQIITQGIPQSNSNLNTIIPSPQPTTQPVQITSTNNMSSNIVVVSPQPQPATSALTHQLISPSPQPSPNPCTNPYNGRVQPMIINNRC